jgi:hypothetical protein
MSEIDDARAELAAWRQLGRDMMPAPNRFAARDDLAIRFLDLLAKADRSDLAMLAVRLATVVLHGGWTPPGGLPAEPARVEWACRWAEGELTPARDEEWARDHARMWHTIPVRRTCGPWVEVDDDPAELWRKKP